MWKKTPSTSLTDIDHCGHSAAEPSTSVPSLSLSISDTNIENARNIMCNNNVQNTNFNYIAGDSQRLLMDDKYFANSRDKDLAFITEWLHKSPLHILWIRGAAATGKSTLLRHLITILRQKRQLGTFYFVQVGCHLDPLEVIKHMAHEMSNGYPGLAVASTSLPSDFPLEDHFAHFVLRSLRLIPTNHTLLIAIDAVDQYEHSIQLLQALCKAEYPRNIKVIFTGCPNELLTSWFNAGTAADRVEVHDLSRIDDLVMRKYIETRLNERRDWRSVDGRPSPENIKVFARKAAGYIGWAAFAANLICDPTEAEPDEVFEDVMNMVPTLDTLYARVLAPLSKRSERNRKVLGIISVIKEPLSKEALDDLTFAEGLPAKDVCNRLKVLQTGDHITPMDLNFHSSFLEFIRDPRRCNPAYLPVSFHDSNLLAFRSCTKLLEKYFLSTSTKISDAASYGAEYWPCHATDITGSLTTPFSSHLREEIVGFIGKFGKTWAHFRARKWCLNLQIDQPDMSNGVEQLRALARTAEGYEEYQLPPRTLPMLIAVQALILRVSGLGDPKRGEDLYTLGALLYQAYVERGLFSHLDQAITISRESLKLLSVDGPKRNCCLNTLGNCLQERYDQRGDTGDVDEAISLYREAVEHFVPRHPHADISLAGLGGALLSRYSRCERRVDLDEAILCFREVVKLCPSGNPRYSSSLRGLSVALSTRYSEAGNERDLSDAITLQREAVLLYTPAGDHRILSGHFGHLANALSMRHEKSGEEEDLEEAITLNRKALTLYPPQGPQRWQFLNRLARVLYSRYKAMGDSKDLDEAVELFSEAVESPVQSAIWRSRLLYDLAGVLCTCYDKRRTVEQLNKAIDLYRMADHPSCKQCAQEGLEEYSSALLKRYAEQGKEEDLDEAIIPLRKSLTLYIPSDPNRRQVLDRLFGVLQVRYDKRSYVEDWKELTLLSREALELDYHARRSLCSNRPVDVTPEYLRQHEDWDVDEVIRVQREMVRLRGVDHPHYCCSLYHLTTALQLRYDKQSRLDDWNDLTVFQRELLELEYGNPQSG